MKIKDVLLRDPVKYPLVNQGQARISDDHDDRAREELRGELETFVCEGQYADGIQKIVRSFLDNLGKTSQRGAWVSGFFGSGKSHLLKMLCHLWRDTPFADGANARSLVPSMPEELRELLRELDTAGKRAGGLIAAAGALPSGTTDNVRLSVLAVLLRAVGLPEHYPLARFCLWLKSEGHFDKVKAAVETGGKKFKDELNNLYVSGLIARAVMGCNMQFAASETEARQFIKAQFPPQTSDITTDDFLRTIKEVLYLEGRDGRLPCTLLILDETQQYIGDSNERSVLVTEVAEAVSKQLDSHVIIVGAGQSALTDIPLLQKLMDRFTIRVPLSDAEVETVTRKVLLQKKPTAVSDIRALLDVHAGEVSRQLQGTRIGEVGEDRAVSIEDYPLLPVRRRFWEHCFRQIDAAGTHSQLRSQLRITHDAVVKVSDRPLGAVVSAYELFESLAPEMVNTGVLLREINEGIIRVGLNDGDLAKRICGLVFLIGKLKRDVGVDIGARASKDHLADLLVDDLLTDNGKLRSEVAMTLKKLADQGVLMRVGDEYRLQTREGSEWEREFRNRQTKLNNDHTAIQFRRDQLLYGEIDRVFRTIKLVHGASKEPRHFLIHREQVAPAIDGSGIPVWIRDGWSCAEKDVVEAAKVAGTASPIVFVFIPRHSADDLRRLIVEVDSAKRTLDARGNPATAEGQEARQSMDSRHAGALGNRDRLIQDVVANTKVFQGGGSEVLLAALEERIREAADASLVRMFPRFKDADFAAWEAVIKRAKEGADQPFSAIGHSDATEKHVVCQEVIATIGAGRLGSDIRKALGGTPFGWPRDAADAALIALHRLEHISATLNGQAVQQRQLDQNRIVKAEFRVEHATLSVNDRLALRKLYSEVGLSCKSGEEATRGVQFLESLATLAKEAGGEMPLPTGPSTVGIEDVQRLVGNEQLVAIRKKAKEWEGQISAWKATAELIAERLPAWGILSRLAKLTAGLPEAKPLLDQIDAIRSERLLLVNSDPVNAARQALAALLRDALQKGYAEHAAAFTEANATLARNNVWVRLDSGEQDRIKVAVGLLAISRPEVSTDGALADVLERTPLGSIQAECAAIAGRVAKAIESAARLLEPKVQMVTVERSTLRDAIEVEAWLGRQKAMLLARIADGPVLVK